MTVSNKPQVQANEQSKSWVQDWLERSAEAHKRMATDENYRQEVASRATSTPAEIQAIKAELKKEYEAQAKHRALLSGEIQSPDNGV